MNLLRNTLEFESSLVNFEAVQLAAPIGDSSAFGVSGASVILVPTPAPSGIFRPGAGF
jgi:hypothetical protein